MLLTLWIVVVLSAILFSYLYADTRLVIRQFIPLEFQGPNIYPFHIQYYLFSSGVPLNVQKKYLLSEAFSIVLFFCVAALFAIYGNYILFALYGVVSIYGLWNLIRDYRRFLKSIS